MADSQVGSEDEARSSSRSRIFLSGESVEESKALVEAEVAGDKNGEDDEENLAMVVQTNALMEGTPVVQESQSGEVGVLTTGDSAWLKKQLNKDYETIYQCLEEGQFPTYIAIRNYASSKGKRVADQVGQATGKIVAGSIQGIVSTHAPFLSCIPVAGDIIQMLTETLPSTIVQAVIAQGVGFVVDLISGAGPPNTGREFVELNAMLPITRTSAFFALIESDTHYNYPLHFQYLGRTVACIFSVMYETFFKKFIKRFVDSEIGMTIVEFIEKHRKDGDLFEQVQIQFERIMQVNLPALLVSFQALFGRLCTHVKEKFKQKLKIAVDSGTEVAKDIRQALVPTARSLWNPIQTFQNVKTKIAGSFEAFLSEFKSNNEKDLDDRVKYFKLKWEIELGFIIFDPSFSLRGDMGLSAFDMVENARGEMVVRQTNYDAFITRSMNILKGGTGENPELPPGKDPPGGDPPGGGGKSIAGLFFRKLVPKCSTSFNLSRMTNMKWIKSMDKLLPPNVLALKAQNPQVSRDFLLSSSIPEISSSPLFQEIDEFLNVKCAEVVGPFLSLVSSMSGMSTADKFQNIQFADTVDPNIRGALVKLGTSSDGHDWEICITVIEDYGATFSILRNGRRDFELPTIGYIFEMLSESVGFSDSDSLVSSIPGPILEIGEGLSLEGLSFLWPLGTNPSVRCGVKFTFDEESPFSTNLGLKAIQQDIELSFLQEGFFFTTQFILSIGEIQIVGTLPVFKEEPFVLDLETKLEPVTLASFISSIPGLGDVKKTSGLGSLASDDTTVEALSIGLGGPGGVDFFDLAIASSESPPLGRVKIIDPYAGLSLTSPFTQDRSVALFYMLSLEVDNFNYPIEMSGELSYEDEKLSGIVTGTMLGSFGMTDVFDLDSEDMPPDLEITEDITISFDLTELRIDQPSVSLEFGDDRILTFASSSFSVAVGGPEQLAVVYSFPTRESTNGLLDAIKLDYTKKVEGQKTPRCIFSAAIATKNNLIEDGLQLLGEPITGHIIAAGQFELMAEKKGKKVKFLMPDGLLPDSVTFGSKEEGLTLSNATGFINPGKRRELEFGVSGQLDFNVLGFDSPFTLIGELSVGRHGFSGLMLYDGEMRIGKHVIVDNFGILFKIEGTTPEAGASTKFRLYEKEGEFQFTMSVVGTVPIPMSFELRYPGELSIKGIVDAFLGEKVSVPNAIGNIIVLAGTIKNAETSERNKLILYFDVGAIEFEIDCHVSVFNGFFKGAVNGKFSMGSGFKLDAWLDPIDLSPVLKISGSQGEDRAEMKIDIPPLTGGKLDIYVDGSVTVLGIERTAQIMVKNEGTIWFRITGKMWGALSAELTVEGDVSNGEGFLEVEAIFQNTIIETITQNSHEVVNNLVKGAKEGLNKAIEELQKKRRQLDNLNAERDDLIALVKKQQKEFVERVTAAKSEVEKWQNQVDSLANTILAKKAVVRKERKAMTNKLAAARRSLDAAKNSLKRIDREIDARRQEVERKMQNLTKEINRFKRSVENAKATVKEWENSVEWFTNEINVYEGRITSKHNAINSLGYWTAWKAAGYWAQIAGYRTTIGGLWVGQRGVQASMWAAQRIFEGVKKTLAGLQATADSTPDWAKDPAIALLNTRKTAANAAFELAKKIIEGADALVEWAPLELDPRVASIILLKETAGAALSGAKAAVSLLRDVSEDLKPKDDLRVKIYDANIVFQKELIDVATRFLEGVKNTVTGPISNVLSFIAQGVNDILNSIPLVIKGVYFKSTLSTASNSGVNLKVDYSFLGNDHELEIGFNFSARAVGEMVMEFGKAIANNILGLSESIEIGSEDVEQPFSLEDLENAEAMVNELGTELGKETEQIELDYEYSQLDLKRQLFLSEETTLQLRGDLLTEHSYTAREDKVILSNIENVISTNEEEGGIRGLSAYDSSKFSNAVSSIKSLLEDLEGKSAAQQEQLRKYGSTLQATKEKIQEEQNQEMSKQNSIAAANLSDEEKVMQENDIKREAIELFKKHEDDLISVIEEDREEEQRIISERRKIYDNTLVHMQTLSELSTYFVEEIESLTENQIATAASSTSANISEEDDDVEPTEGDEMLLKMVMYQVNLTSANESIQKRALYDRCLFQISSIESSIPSVLGLMRNGGEMSPPSRQQS